MSTLYYESNLMHFGIPGMKWGIRRYQNKDGSLTPRGEKRYQKEMQKIAASQQAERRKLALEQARVKEARKTEQAKMRLKKEQEGLRDDKHKTQKTQTAKKESIPTKTVKDYSNDELKAIITRADLEKQYLSIATPSKKNKVPDWIAEMGKTALSNIVLNAANNYGQALGKRLADSEKHNK